MRAKQMPQWYDNEDVASNNARGESQSQSHLDTHNLDGGGSDKTSSTPDGADYANNDSISSGG
jgi:hypothetical protein